MYKKDIPDTNSENYISGWEALNIPDENRNTADWHPITYLYSSIPGEKIKLYNTKKILGDKGIKKKNDNFS